MRTRLSIPRAPVLLATRRSLVRILAAAGAALKFPAAGFGTVFQVDRLLSRRSTEETEVSERRYRADAVIMLLSIPVYSRAGVGSGAIALRCRRGGDCRVVSLEFAAGSFPGRAKGLNRLGFIREVVGERDGAAPEAAYFGFMTSSPEENLDEARRALKTEAEDQIPYTAIDGYAGGSVSRARIARFRFPARYNWHDWPHLVNEVRESFETRQPVTRETPLPASGTEAVTFLHAVLRAFSSAGERFETAYVYNGRQFRLRTEKSPDGRAGRQFAERGLCGAGCRVVRLHGLITEESNRRETQFKIWIDESSGSRLPVRIEFQPRSFLRLAFEFEPVRESTAVRKEDL